MTWTDTVTLVRKKDRRPELRERIRQAYVRTPDLRVTLPEAGRLWDVEVSTCRQLLDGLVSDGFLESPDDSCYQRPIDSPPTAAAEVAHALTR